MIFHFLLSCSCQDSCKDSFKEVNKATNRAEAGEPERDDRWLPPSEQTTGTLRNFHPAARRLPTFKATCVRRTKDQLGASEGPRRFLIDSGSSVAPERDPRLSRIKRGGKFTAVLFFNCQCHITKKKKSKGAVSVMYSPHNPFALPKAGGAWGGVSKDWPACSEQPG